MLSFTNILIHSQVLRIVLSKLQLFQQLRGIICSLQKIKLPLV